MEGSINIRGTFPALTQNIQRWYSHMVAIKFEIYSLLIFDKYDQLCDAKVNPYGALFEKMPPAPQFDFDNETTRFDDPFRSTLILVSSNILYLWHDTAKVLGCYRRWTLPVGQGPGSVLAAGCGLGLGFGHGRAELQKRGGRWLCGRALGATAWTWCATWSNSALLAPYLCRLRHPAS